MSASRYQAPNAQAPDIAEVAEISRRLGLGISDSELRIYHESIKKSITEVYPVLEKYVEPSLPVRYPRVPGYRPQIGSIDNPHNAWYYKSEIAGAPEGVLKGRRVVVKDSFPVAGVPMMHGSRVVEGYTPDYDATIVTRVLDAGGTIVGKAVCEDFCYEPSSFSSHPAPVLNPHDPRRSAGGSSSGCAVLIQTGEADMGLGGDQGGSIRMPAAYCGIVGLKPTYGLVPYTGIGSMAPSVDHCGPMARTVRDCALLLQAIAGDDEGRDMRQRNIPEKAALPKYSEMLTGLVSGLKVGLLREGFQECDADVASVVESAARKITSKAAEVEFVSVPMHSDGHCVGPPSYYPTSAMDSYHAFLSARNRDSSPTVKLLQLQGEYMTKQYGLHFYAKSQNLMSLLRQKYDEILAKVDVLVMPTMRTTAPELPRPGPEDSDSILRAHLSLGHLMANCAPFDGTGHPAISLPAGTSAGLPVGMMIVGRHLQDDKVLNVAHAYEQILQTEHCQQ